MTRTKNKRSASLPSDSDNEFPKSKSKKTESYAEELLEPYLDDPEDSLSGLSLNEYLDINDLLFRFKDKKLIPRYLPVFEFASKQSKLLINKIQSANSEEKSCELSNIESNLNKLGGNIDVMKNELSKISKAISPTASFKIQSHPATYAQAASLAPTAKNEAKLPSQTKTIVIRSTSDANPVNPTIMDNKVKKIISESKIKAKIVNIKTTKSSVIINSADENNENIENLIKSINNHSMNNNSFKAYTPRKLDPTIVIKGVSIDNNITTIISQMIENNPQLANIENATNEIKFLFKRKNRNPRLMDLILRVSPRIFQTINQQLRNNIYIDFQYCRIEHQVLVKQCQNCYQYGHKKGDCKNTAVCRNCGGSWNKNHQCENPNLKCCINCKNHIHHQNETNHSSNSELCPIYISQMKRVLERTQFHPD
ncbi:hypothetical protein SSS_07470 [Sarcoptes scabiei]|uniref:CCHC-type domain-containing protein n=1 Tax=Sarcoptes scabiei TaxID=52283 RepID=A0A834V9Q9_SARSC|nr:hypothetical protein SSS_07470 [Sarcoptes scabiei]